MGKINHNDLCVGIDLGTTNSALATISTARGKVSSPVMKIRRHTNANGVNGILGSDSRELLPSCVYYRHDREGGYNPIVGDFAKNQYNVKPWLVAKSIKSQMGQKQVSGLAEDIPDKTPEEVSARILKHMLNAAKDYYMEDIEDAVITVPASFNSAMREATFRAAELAGINVRNEDGTFNDDIILSEPEAVIYDLINQFQNGEYENGIDFSEKKRVMVFDIGGGTLDITIHDVERDAENPGILNTSPIAISRYTRLGGDDFDSVIADEMYKRYTDSVCGSPEILKQIEKDETVRPHLLTAAEGLKCDISNRYFELKQLGKEKNDTMEYHVDAVSGRGYYYDDVFTRDEFEEIVSPLMGYGLELSDYKRLDAVSDTYNIVYPLLDVMKKAADKPGCDDVRIDAVILNGGMSKLYLIQDRLESLFGFRPISVSDPDRSVAMGAAVYHYYLHKNANAVKRFRMPNELPETDGISVADRCITTGRSILNNDIYLGLKGGAVQPLCSAGQELPYISEVMTGFSINANQNMLSVPLKEQSGRNSYKTIACGTIEFKRSYKRQTPVSIRFGISKSQIITIEAWTSADDAGADVIEKGNVMLCFGDGGERAQAAKIAPRSGTKLIAANEISNIKNLCDALKNNKGKVNKKGGQSKNIREDISMSESIIKECGNPEDFAEPILSYLMTCNNEYFKQILFNLSCSLAEYWTAEQRHRLGRLAYSVIEPEILGFKASGGREYTSSCAIRALAHSGEKKLCEKLSDLALNIHYKDSLIYTFKAAEVNTDLMYRLMSSKAEEEDSEVNNKANNELIIKGLDY